MRPRDWSVGCSHFLAVAQIAVSSVKRSLSLSEVNCARALWNETVYRSLNVLCASKNYLYVVCVKCSVNGTRKQTKQKIQTN
jgi:hypothetical protein